MSETPHQLDEILKHLEMLEKKCTIEDIEYLTDDRMIPYLTRRNMKIHGEIRSVYIVNFIPIPTQKSQAYFIKPDIVYERPPYPEHAMRVPPEMFGTPTPSDDDFTADELPYVHLPEQSDSD